MKLVVFHANHLQVAFVSAMVSIFHQFSNPITPDLWGFLAQWDCQKHPDALIAASNLAALLQEDGKYAESAEA